MKYEQSRKCDVIWLRFKRVFVHLGQLTALPMQYSRSILEVIGSQLTTQDI